MLALGEWRLLLLRRSMSALIGRDPACDARSSAAACWYAGIDGSTWL